MIIGLDLAAATGMSVAAATMSRPACPADSTPPWDTRQVRWQRARLHGASVGGPAQPTIDQNYP